MNYWSLTYACTFPNTLLIVRIFLIINNEYYFFYELTVVIHFLISSPALFSHYMWQYQVLSHCSKKGTIVATISWSAVPFGLQLASSSCTHLSCWAATVGRYVAAAAAAAAQVVAEAIKSNVRWEELCATLKPNHLLTYTTA